jgi:putative MATE family efflux protein
VISAALRRSPHDREILKLAALALGALAAQPTFVLVDTAIVGHLGTNPLAGLAVAGTVLTATFAIFNFLAYSTTGAVARQLGAGNRRAAAEVGVDGLWLATGLGVLLTALGLVFAPVIVDAMGASDRVHPFAETYLLISILGAPALLVTLAGAGYMRGLQDTRTTLVIAVASNAANLLIEILFVYGLDLGIAGSAWGTVLAQYGAALAYIAIAARTVRLEHASVRPQAAGIRAAASVGGRLVIRTGSLLAAFLAATAIASRIGDDDVAAHQIAFQVFLFLGLSLDALAIAGQAMVGRFLGAEDAREARSAARRMIEWGIAVGVVFGALLLILRPLIVPLFTPDADVQALALQVLVIVAVMQPLNAVVFVLDGILIGAGDVTYLAWAMLVATLGVFAPAAAAVLVLDGGLLWLWGALVLWMGARGVGMAARFVGSRWQLTGAVRAV